MDILQKETATAFSSKWHAKVEQSVCCCQVNTAAIIHSATWPTTMELKCSWFIGVLSDRKADSQNFFICSYSETYLPKLSKLPWQSSKQALSFQLLFKHLNPEHCTVYCQTQNEESMWLGHLPPPNVGQELWSTVIHSLSFLWYLVLQTPDFDHPRASAIRLTNTLPLALVVLCMLSLSCCLLH